MRNQQSPSRENDAPSTLFPNYNEKEKGSDKKHSKLYVPISRIGASGLCKNKTMLRVSCSDHHMLYREEDATQGRAEAKNISGCKDSDEIITNEVQRDGERWEPSEGRGGGFRGSVGSSLFFIKKEDFFVFFYLITKKFICRSDWDSLHFPKPSLFPHCMGA